MASSSSSSSSSDDDFCQTVDEFYFSALHDDNGEIFPISDEKYAQELQLQEALISASESLNKSSYQPSSSHASSSTMKCKEPLTESITVVKIPSPSNNIIQHYCGICMDTKTASEMFQNINQCTHMFCTDCIREHVAAKIKENLTMVICPDPNCKGVIGPEVCQSINVPKEVLERWDAALCESVIMGSQKFYCPFKDCSAMLVDDGGVEVTSSECPNCNRLFCAQCKVAWHSGVDCNEFKSLAKGDRNPEDLMLMDLAKNKKWMRCPSCRIFVEKIDGCQHISCRCGYHFCYGCGKKNDGTSHVCAAV